MKHGLTPLSSIQSGAAGESTTDHDETDDPLLQIEKDDDSTDSDTELLQIGDDDGNCDDDCDYREVSCLLYGTILIKYNVKISYCLLLAMCQCRA